VVMIYVVRGCEN